MPENTVYVGRPSIWGNPFTGDDAVEKYREAVSVYPIPDNIMIEWLNAGGSESMLIALTGGPEKFPIMFSGIKGKDLCCWCPLDKPCHADILLKIANERILDYAPTS